MLNDDEIKKLVDEYVSRSDELLKKLDEENIDRTEDRPIDHHFFAPDQPEASALGQALYKAGYPVQLMAPVEDDDGDIVWALEASRQQTANAAAERGQIEELVRLAAELDCDYDGWGVPIEGDDDIDPEDEANV